MNIILRHAVRRLIRNGNLKITGPDGRTFQFGDGADEPVHICIKTRHAERAITLDPSRALPEAYMNGQLNIVQGDVLALLRTAYRNMEPTAGMNMVWMRVAEGLRATFRRFQQINTAGRARRNIERHYDLSNEFYRLFLDKDMQYSCAYFERPDMTLEEAQLAKKRHIAAKLKIQPEQTVLDIGSGWGGMGLYLAENFDANVLGITLSTAQYELSCKRARAAGLGERLRFELRDYRSLSERFDRIVSVGMFEHVGINHYRSFFSNIARVLRPDGVMLLHSIGRAGPPAPTNSFIRRHIFPGGYIPALSEVLPHIEKAGLFVTDIEVLRLHYAETLQHWRQRFLANWQRAREIYDERFCRMWEFYLSGSEAAFRWQDMVVFQIQLAHRNDAVPITRRYIGEHEKTQARREAARKASVPFKA